MRVNIPVTYRMSNGGHVSGGLNADVDGNLAALAEENLKEMQRRDLKLTVEMLPPTILSITLEGEGEHFGHWVFDGTESARKLAVELGQLRLSAECPRCGGDHQWCTQTTEGEF